MNMSDNEIQGSSPAAAGPSLSTLTPPSTQATPPSYTVQLIDYPELISKKYRTFNQENGYVQLGTLNSIIGNFQESETEWLLKQEKAIKELQRIQRQLNGVLEEKQLYVDLKGKVEAKLKEKGFPV